MRCGAGELVDPLDVDRPRTPRGCRSDFDVHPGGTVHVQCVEPEVHTADLMPPRRGAKLRAEPDCGGRDVF
jgi:hypothetical protein